jgi:hypothetical protein
MLQEPIHQHALDASEQFADRNATGKTLRQCRAAIAPANHHESTAPGYAAWTLDCTAKDRHRVPWFWLNEAFRNTLVALKQAGRQWNDEVYQEMSDASSEARALQATFLRDIFNPFRSDVHAWTATSKMLAEAIYESHAFGRLPILADAVDEAGCGDADILGHLRRPGPHVRGCWVIDAILGKK